MRSHLIDEMIREDFAHVGVICSTTTIERYAALPHRPEKRLGIYGPLPYPEPPAVREPDQPPYRMVFSPEYLDNLTEELDDDEFDTTLNTVLYMAHMMIALGRELPDEVERFRSIEDEIVKTYPGSLHLLNQIELRELDRAEATGS